MKSRNLGFYNPKKILLGFAVLSTFAFVSCSRSLTSIESSKKLQTEQVLVSPSLKTEKEMAAIPQIANPAPIVVAQSHESTTVPKSHNPGNDIRIGAKTSAVALKIASVKKQVLNKVENQVQGVQNLTKNDKIASYTHAARPEFGMIRRGIVLIVFGLIFILIGALLPWPLGELFYIIGVIFLIVGILDLLFGLMRSAM